MAVLLANNAASTLAGSINSTQTTIAVQSGEGSKFPSPTGGDWFPVTLAKSDGTYEICRCTGRSNDNLTIVRAQEGTAGTAFASGDVVELRLTAGAIAQVKTDVEADHGTAAYRDVDTSPDGVVETSELDSRLGTSGNLGNAATKNVGTGSSQVPQNNDLGSAAYAALSSLLQKSEFEPANATLVWSGVSTSVNFSSLSEGGDGFYVVKSSGDFYLMYVTESLDSGGSAANASANDSIFGLYTAEYKNGAFKASETLHNDAGGSYNTPQSITEIYKV